MKAASQWPGLVTSAEMNQMGPPKYVVLFYICCARTGKNIWPTQMVPFYRHRALWDKIKGKHLLCQSRKKKKKLELATNLLKYYWTPNILFHALLFYLQEQLHLFK